MKQFDVAIIGGGIVGTAIAYELAKYQLTVGLFEKNPVLARETSFGNSGVIHGGFDPEPHKVEARLNVLGNKLWVEQVFPHLHFPHRQVDSLVIGFNEEEMEHVRMLYHRGLENGVASADLKVIDREELLNREPHLNPKALGALLCTSSWVVDPVKAATAFAGAAMNNGMQLFLKAAITRIHKIDQLFQVTVNETEQYQARIIINAAGHYADLIAAMAGYPDFQQTTRRGEYRVLDSSQASLVNSVCFKVPTIHGKGVIVAPLLNGNLLVGPTAEEGIPKTDTSLITPAKYNYIGQIGRDLVPSLDLDRTVLSFAGSRPIDIATNDFVIQAAKNEPCFINAAGMQSPGLSSAPATALEIVKLIQATGINLVKRPDFQPDYTVL
ncbi:glycerol-3-phosphate dehydrogenase [Mycoplasmoides fastidiosum]|uniref:Glycerol-3-phosphate dehydrogenase n=1 Tax=Mycoplasmoides fastidiosum TaxID=92758 RepID=A0ABU0M073_9BACT|nr:type 2 glycerol-3-phosphate oxidase [Mycoplasmoides fastidiosum]MDQ0514245.1 glycerol-3-phosphate dehydrogenase [Mycoplasmoides fastidiosum]UUD37347.1 type 2 glycerol-3-phosphate oxidase [Mycoplasmoides fastidiosum]